MLGLTLIDFVHGLTFVLWVVAVALMVSITYRLAVVIKNHWRKK